MLSHGVAWHEVILPSLSNARAIGEIGRRPIPDAFRAIASILLIIVC
jgi:hypothetical protein